MVNCTLRDVLGVLASRPDAILADTRLVLDVDLINRTDQRCAGGAELISQVRGSLAHTTR